MPQRHIVFEVSLSEQYKEAQAQAEERFFRGMAPELQPKKEPFSGLDGIFGYVHERGGCAHGIPLPTKSLERRDSLARELFSEFVLAPEWQHLSYKEMARQAREAAEAFE